MTGRSSIRFFRRGAFPLADSEEKGWIGGAWLLRGVVFLCGLWLMAAISLAQPPGVYVADEDNNAVRVLNPLTRAIETTIPVGAGPAQIAPNLSGSRVFVPNRDSDSVSVIDTQTRTVIATIVHSTIRKPVAVGFANGGAEVWIVNQTGGPASTGSITILNAQTLAFVDEISSADLFAQPAHIALDASGTRAYVVNRASGTVLIILVIPRTILLSVKVGLEPCEALFSPLDGAVYVSNAASNSISRFDTVNPANLSDISIPGNPCKMALSFSRSRIFVATQNNRISFLEIPSLAQGHIPFANPSVSTFGVALQPGTPFGFASDQNNNAVVGFNTLSLAEITGGGFPVTGLAIPRAIGAAGAVRVSDLSVAKTDSPDPVRAGAILTYSVVVKNAGPSPATETTLTDPLPAGVELVSAAASQGSCQVTPPRVVVCELGTLPAADSASVSIRVLATQVGVVANKASVSSAETDPNPADNTSETATTVLPVSDVLVSIVDSPDPVRERQTLTYEVTATNRGPSFAERVSLLTAIPDSVQLLSLDTGVANCVTASVFITCNLETLVIDQSRSITIRVRPLARGVIISSARVSSATPDPDESNNEVLEATRVDPLRADLEVVKTALSPLAAAGSKVPYRIEVRNLGPDSDPQVLLSDLLPGGLEFVSITPGPSLKCETAGEAINCQAAVAEGESVAAILKARVLAGNAGPVNNTAQAASSGNDPNLENNQSTAVTRIVARGDVNGDGAVDAADLQALILEINDGDGESVDDVFGGSFAGNVVMDVNLDDLVNRQDVVALTALIFGP